jgi:hypothetical protein
MLNFTSPSKTASNPMSNNGLFLGTVKKIEDDGGVFVEIPYILAGFSFGPASVANYEYTPAIDDRVVCGFINNALDEVIVLGKVAFGTMDTAFGTPKPDQATQLGSRLASGVADYYGGGMALSRDGQRIAIGAHLDDTAFTNAGRAQVFEYVDGEWAQMGDDFLGTVAQGQFGRTAALNGDGSVVAFGAESTNSYEGLVRVADYVNGSWVERTTLTGGSDSYFGHSVALSSDGSRLAVGAYHDDTAASAAGKVQVFDWDGSAWTQVGSDLLGGAAVDYFGYDVDLTPDGNRLIVGAERDDVGALTDAGSVTVYDWDGSSWTQVGSLISGTVSNNRIGFSVKLSADGETFVTGNPYAPPASYTGEVSVYTWNGSDWEKKGFSLVGVATVDYFGHEVAINTDGTRIAVGHFGFDTPAVNGTTISGGAVRVYDWNGSSWVQVAGNFNAGTNNSFGHRVGMSDDGRVIAGSSYGSPYEVRVFGFY